MTVKNSSLLNNINRVVHFVGIGGVSMSALAEALNFRGFPVKGSDMQKSVHTKRLEKLGIHVTIGHDARNVDGADFVIRNSAISDENPEILRARELNLPVLERAEAWGILMEEFSNVVCVSGTHGKTTTTSMCTHIALEARLNPQVMVGAYLPIIGGGLRVAQSDLFIAEACEYCNSFLNFKPTVAVILNVEEDHLDFFSGIDDIIKSFNSFAKKTPQNGTVIVNADDENALKTTLGLNRNILTFSIKNDANIKAEEIVFEDGYPAFSLISDGEKLVDIRLSVRGIHNVYNALAASGAALSLGISPKCIAAGLLKFTGAGRRFEYKGEFNGAKVYDDYAHHPSEITATLHAARQSGYQNIICVFQPHTYTRTAALKDEFISALSLADKVLLADIYAAREKNTIGISSGDIASGLKNSEYLPSFEMLANRLRELAKEGDLILTMGAGDIYRVGDILLNK